MTQSRLIPAIAFLVASALSAPASAGPLEDLQPGEWFAAPSSELEPYMPPQTGDDWGGRGSIITAWNGGAYDTYRDRFIIWGGGHHDYAGNEIYVFDIESLAWSRLTDRSADVGGDEASGYYPDGLPRSRHTYEYIEYVPPPFDRFCSFGGAALFPSGQIGISNVDCFNFDTLTWQRMADTPTASIGAVAAVDPVTGRVWMQGAGNSLVLAAFDPSANEWTRYATEPSGWFEYSHTAEIDPVRRTFVAVGGGEVVVWDLDRPDDEPIRLATSGATSIQDRSNPGLAYDVAGDRLVAYSGGGDVYTLDLDTGVWSLHLPSASNTVVPPAATENGTYGRFRYIPSKNVFVTVHAINQSVYFYKLTEGPGIIPPDAGPNDGDADAGANDDDAGGGGGADGTPGGCGCRAGASGHAPVWLAIVSLLGLGFRRRRLRR